MTPKPPAKRPRPASGGGGSKVQLVPIILFLLCWFLYNRALCPFHRYSCSIDALGRVTYYRQLEPFIGSVVLAIIFAL